MKIDKLFFSFYILARIAISLSQPEKTIAQDILRNSQQSFYIFDAITAIYLFIQIKNKFLMWRSISIHFWYESFQIKLAKRISKFNESSLSIIRVLTFVFSTISNFIFVMVSLSGLALQLFLYMGFTSERFDIFEQSFLFQIIALFIAFLLVCVYTCYTNNCTQIFYWLFFTPLFIILFICMCSWAFFSFELADSRLPLYFCTVIVIFLTWIIGMFTFEKGEFLLAFSLCNSLILSVSASVFFVGSEISIFAFHNKMYEEAIQLIISPYSLASIWALFFITTNKLLKRRKRILDLFA